MPKTKTFIVRHEYLANYGQEDRTSDTRTPVQVSNYQNTYRTLEQAVQAHNNLSPILHSEFIYNGLVKQYSQVGFNSFPRNPYIAIPSYIYRSFGNGFDMFDPFVPFGDFNCSYNSYNGYGVMHYNFIPNPNYGRGQRDTFTYQQYNVAPVLEELVVNHGTDYRGLMSSASDEGKKELLNFTNIDLANADLSNLDLTKANFTRCNLQRTPGITQEVLDNSETYLYAKLPKGLIEYWSNTKRYLVLKEIEKLANYGLKLSGSTFDDAYDKGVLVTALAAELKEKITSTTKYNGKFHKEFLTILSKHDDKFSEKRFYGLKMILSNIALCVLTLGMAGVINYSKTGSFLFFNKTKTQERVGELLDTACASEMGAQR